MLDEKSHDLPSTSWKARKASAVIQSESKGLGTGVEWGGADGVSHDLSWKAGEPEALTDDWGPGQEKMDLSAQAERVNLLFPCLFVLFGLSKDWLVPTHIGEGNLFYSIHQFKC